MFGTALKIALVGGINDDGFDKRQHRQLVQRAVGGDIDDSFGEQHIDGYLGLWQEAAWMVATVNDGLMALVGNGIDGYFVGR